MIRVSTVIPAYNAERYLRPAIDSVLAQMGVANEVIVVDDGSTDSTPAILKEYADRIRVVRQTNSGLSAARNAGIAESRAEYVAILDADDIWLPEKLSKQLSLLDANPQYAMVHSRTYSWDAETDERTDFVKANQSLYQDDCFGQLFTHNAICVSSVVVRRALLTELGGFDSNITRPTTQDHDLWLRITHKHPIGFVEQPGVLYRRHADNASHDTVGMLEDRVYVLEKAIRYGRKELGQCITAPHATLAHACYLTGYQHFQVGQYEVAKRWLRKACSYGRRDVRSFCGAYLPTFLLKLVHRNFVGASAA